MTEGVKKHDTHIEPVENQIIFLRYSLVYLLSFLYIILLPFTFYFVSFLFHYFVYIYRCLYTMKKYKKMMFFLLKMNE